MQHRHKPSHVGRNDQLTGDVEDDGDVRRTIKRRTRRFRPGLLGKPGHSLHFEPRPRFPRSIPYDVAYKGRVKATTQLRWPEDDGLPRFDDLMLVIDHVRARRC